MEASTKAAVGSRVRAAEQFSRWKIVGTILGPTVAVALWFAPITNEAAAHHAIAIIAFMIVYWIFEPIDYGITALAGCYLFWALHVVSFATAFSGFADSTPWYMFGAMLLGEAVVRSGLGLRLGYIVIRVIGVSYSKLLLSIIVLVVLLNFLVPSGMAQIVIVAPMIIGIVAAFGLQPLSNVGRGLFIVLTYACGLFNKMILSGGASILTVGIIHQLTGTTVYWGQFLMAYMPAVVVSVFACWRLILWLYPPEKTELPDGRAHVQSALAEMGPWTLDEKKTIFWLCMAVGLWATDKLHHVRPEVIALGIGLALAFPKVGVLRARAIREINFLLIVFLGGVLSMGEVMLHTKVLDLFSGAALLPGVVTLFRSPFIGTNVLYWGGVVYHFVLASEFSMLSTSLPIVIRFAQAHGYNPVAIAMVWSFAGGGKLFVYQSSVLMLGYSYGYFKARDLLRVGFYLTVVEGVIMAFLVPFYWPLIGLHWLQ